ncbi:MAG: flotillin family protein [Deltaproteobacteria bacterium]|nr:flotillin family protein [Deltaproteobacteria bacterium]MBW2530171.1 flotillin family protein [Deltaproteobacteria bacterium]
MTVLGAAAAVVVAFIILIIIVKRFLYICGPHEVLVFAGRKHRLKDGTVSNFTIMTGGRGLRRPFVETVRRMDIRLFPVEVVVQNAYSAGQIPLQVHAIGNVKVSSNPVEVRNAAERFLNQHPSQIAVAAQQTLEGVLREVVSELTPEQVNEDRLKFAHTLADNAHDDLSKLGLELDVLKIQHVSDEQEYLSNLGRGRIAKMLRDAENAENAAKQAIAEANASSRQRAETAQKKAETEVVQAKNNADTELAKLEAKAKQVENQASMAAETAKAMAEQRQQELRAELEKLRLRNDVVLPSEAKAKAAELKAMGEAAPAIENGKAAAAALKAVADQWAAAGQYGRDVYVLQQLKTLAEAAGKRVAQSQIGSLKVVAGDDEAYGTVLASHASAVARVLHATGNALGLDLERLLGGFNDGGGAPPGGPRASRPPLRGGSTPPKVGGAS